MDKSTVTTILRDALIPYFSQDEAEAILHILACAEKIAYMQRGEDHVQGLDAIRDKFLRECDELDEAMDRKDIYGIRLELADIAYYSIQDFYHTEDAPALYATIWSFAKMGSVSVAQVLQDAVVKYDYRSSAPNMKNDAVERALLTE